MDLHMQFHTKNINISNWTISKGSFIHRAHSLNAWSVSFHRRKLTSGNRFARCSQIWTCAWSLDLISAQTICIIITLNSDGIGHPYPKQIKVPPNLKPFEMCLNWFWLLQMMESFEMWFTFSLFVYSTFLFCGCSFIWNVISPRNLVLRHSQTINSRKVQFMFKTSSVIL